MGSEYLVYKTFLIPICLPTPLKQKAYQVILFQNFCFYENFSLKSFLFQIFCSSYDLKNSFCIYKLTFYIKKIVFFFYKNSVLLHRFCINYYFLLFIYALDSVLFIPGEEEEGKRRRGRRKKKEVKENKE